MLFNISRKDLNEAIKWSKKNSPVAYFVLSMNGKWGVPGENPDNIVSAFKRLWPDTCSYLKTASIMNYKDGGKIRFTEFDFNYPQPRIKLQIHNDFLLLIKNLPKYMEDAEEYGVLESFAREMLAIFHWSDENRGLWEGTIAFAQDKQGRYEEAYQFYKSLPEKNEASASVYAGSLLDRVDVGRAEEVLSPYRESDDEVLQGRIALLDRLKAVKAPTPRT